MQLKWTDCIVELMFLYSGMNNLDSSSKSGLSGQIQQILDRIQIVIQRKEDALKSQLELIGQLELLE